MRGSPNEVAPDPELDDYFDVKTIELDCVGCLNSYENYFAPKHTVWTLNMLEGERTQFAPVSIICPSCVNGMIMY